VRVLFVASEVEGFAETGGLAAVAGALPRALAERSLQVAVIMPYYRAVRQNGIEARDLGLRFCIQQGPRSIEGSIWQACLPGSDVPVYLIGQPEFFDRYDQARGCGLYQCANENVALVDYRCDAREPRGAACQRVQLHSLCADRLPRLPRPLSRCLPPSAGAVAATAADGHAPGLVVAAQRGGVRGALRSALARNLIALPAPPGPMARG
jgi:hypothetical protein